MVCVCLKMEYQLSRIKIVKRAKGAYFEKRRNQSVVLSCMSGNVMRMQSMIERQLMVSLSRGKRTRLLYCHGSEP